MLFVTSMFWLFELTVQPPSVKPGYNVVNKSETPNCKTASPKNYKLTRKYELEHLLFTFGIQYQLFTSNLS